MEVCTIGFTQRTAENFFGTLRKAGVRRLLAVRLNNRSQLAGFSKKEDLAYFLRELCQAEYVHVPLLAPTQEMLDQLKKQKGAWSDYERQFLGLMAERKVEETVPRELFSLPCVLLCSEAKPQHCHRRLVVEYLQTKWGSLTVRHL